MGNGLPRARSAL